jgi:acyl transferase domain-containing protein/acyl carrier protein
MQPTSNRYPNLSPLKQALLALEDMQGRLAEFERERAEPIAVIGLGCRFPHAADPDRFWELLRRGEDAVGDVPAARWAIEDYYDPNPNKPGKMSTRWGGFLDSVDQFDPEFFGISPREAVSMDPQQRLLLEVVWEALENAGQGPRALRAGRTGVFVGIASDEYLHRFYRDGDLSAFDAYFASGIARSVAGGRISYTLGIEGPNLSIDTACSSSLVAVHTACLYLHSKECRMALAGGVNVILSPEIGIAFSKSGMMAADGRCKAFDSGADGFVRAEGCGIVVLKRLSDALADGDRIMALIRGSAVNQDGHSSGLTVPSLSAQQAVLRQALAAASIAPAEVGYVEAHGTGTSLGDPIEARALATVLGLGRTLENPLIVGSVKTNLGHLEAASGVAGLIKTILLLEKEEIPQHLHFRTLNPHIDWCGMPVLIPSLPQPWPRGERRRIAGVSAFGFSGTNAHVVLEEAPTVPESSKIDRPLHLLALSARSEAALEQLVHRYEALDGSSEALGDICHTANAGRAHWEHRLTATGRSTEEIRHQLLAAVPGNRVRDREGVRAVFLFPGQGAQYFGMGKELFETQPVFRQALEECAGHLSGELDAPLNDVLWGGAGHLLDQTKYTQPALFSIEYSLARLWQSWGIEPTVVLGHSVGEYVAACVAGVYGLSDGLKLVAARGRLMQAVSGQGGMLAAEMTEQQAGEMLAGLEHRVSLAAVNGPKRVVISGYEEELTQVRQRLERAGVRWKRLTVSHGFHSPQMAEMEEEFEHVAGGIRYGEPQVELISSVTGQPMRGAELKQSSYWRKQVRQPVRFAAAMERLGKYTVFLEAGPGTTLAGLGRECLEQGQQPDTERMWATSLRPGRGEWEQMLDSLGQLYVWGAEVNWHGFDAPYQRRKVALPTYPFQRQRYWVETKPRKAEPSDSEMFERSIEVAGASPTRVWETRVGSVSRPYLADHRAFGPAIFPLTGYLELAVTATGAGTALEDIILREPLALPPQEDQTVQMVYRGDTLEIFSRHEGGWKQHFTARVAVAETPVPTARPLDRCDSMKRTEDIQDIYSSMRRRGMDFGPAFRVMRDLWISPGEAVARVFSADLERSRPQGHNIHPTILDGCFQAIAAALPEGNEDLYLPVRLERFQLHRASAAELWSHAVRRTASGSNMIAFDISIFDPDGPVAEVRGMEFVRVSATRPVPMFEVQWEGQPCGVDPASISGEWLILGDRDSFAATLSQRLSSHYATCFTLDDSARLKTTLEAKEWTGIIHLGSLSAPSVDGLTGAELAVAQRLVCGSILNLVQTLASVNHARPPRLWLVTRGAQAVGVAQERVEVVQALVWGMANAIAEEHPEWRCVRVDLDPAADAANCEFLCKELAAGTEEQVAVRAGERLVSRLAAHKETTQPETPRRLAIETRGVLENLQVQPAARHIIPAGSVEIEVHATGLNFRDVLNVLGMFTGALGSECAGRIAGVGEGVNEFAIGDEVIAFAAGSHDGYVIADARLVAPKPANLNAVQAATLPTSFLTARYTLDHLAKINRGDLILIHAAAGGVGLAAVQIAQRAGAKIFATAGSDRKRSFLRELGVQHVMDSRSLGFAREVLEITGGQGVDIVLNSLAGDFVGASFSALATHGRFIEIGKRDLWTAERVEELGRGIQYHIVDLGQVASGDPEILGYLLRDCVRAIECGELRPLPAAVFGFDNAVSAYRYMAQAQHIGKIVLRQNRCGADILPGGTYLVTGGFGGIGVQLLRWLVQRGARNIVSVGRHEPEAEARKMIEWAQKQGARVAVKLADVADAGQLSALLGEIASSMPPLRGILHAAGAIDDGVLTEQNWERFARVLAAKTVGSWLLHELTTFLPLDFFVMFSSLASIVGAPGQANYAAANAFQDALAHERVRRGLPAVSINWGAWAAGMAARDGLESRRRKLGVDAMSADEALRVLDSVLLEKPVQVGVGFIRWNQIAGRQPGSPASRRLAALTGAGEVAVPQARAEGTFLERLADSPSSRRGAILQEHVHALALRVLGFPTARRIDPQKPLNELGLDSLMAVEFRNLLASEVGQNLSSTLLFNYPAIEDVAAHLARLLFGTNGGPQSNGLGAAVSRDPLDFIEDLSEEDVDKLLASKLEATNG